jgi:hypothetical protein
METRTLTAKEMLDDVPNIMGTLLMRFGRDASSLSDYLTKEEQDKWLRHIEYAVRNRLLIEHRWTHEAAGAMATKYRLILTARLARPDAFSRSDLNVHRK